MKLGWIVPWDANMCNSYLNWGLYWGIIFGGEFPPKTIFTHKYIKGSLIHSSSHWIVMKRGWIVPWDVNMFNSYCNWGTLGEFLMKKKKKLNFHSFDNVGLCRIGSVGSVSASRTVGREFASRPGHTKDHHKNGTNCLPAKACMG